MLLIAMQLTSYSWWGFRYPQNYSKIMLRILSVAHEEELRVPDFVLWLNHYYLGFPWWLSGKESTFKCRRHGLDPWVGMILWRRKRLPTPGFLHGNPVDRGVWQATVHEVARVRHDWATIIILSCLTAFPCSCIFLTSLIKSAL